jgi:hypothetical protein
MLSFFQPKDKEQTVSAPTPEPAKPTFHYEAPPKPEPAAIKPPKPVSKYKILDWIDKDRISHGITIREASLTLTCDSNNSHFPNSGKFGCNYEVTVLTKAEILQDPIKDDYGDLIYTLPNNGYFSAVDPTSIDADNKFKPVTLVYKMEPFKVDPSIQLIMDQVNQWVVVNILHEFSLDKYSHKGVFVMDKVKHANYYLSPDAANLLLTDGRHETNGAVVLGLQRGTVLRFEEHIWIFEEEGCFFDDWDRYNNKYVPKAVHDSRAIEFDF